MTKKDFPDCPICESSFAISVYSGAVRDGNHGDSCQSEVRRCAGCGVERLAEHSCLTHESYISDEYRAHISQDHDTRKHFSIHDELARFTLDVLWPRSLRGLAVADIGCGGGALLDHLAGVADQLIAIEPGLPWTEDLKARGYHWFQSVDKAIEQWEDSVDVALSIQVIEHVEDPRLFLSEIACLLTDDGFVVVSTPNRNDVLMELLPDTFPQFFYRSQHRWAFDADSLARCAELAGLSVIEIRHVHRYGLANTMHWMKEGKPKGRTPMPTLDLAIDMHWQAWLEANGKADNLYMIAKRI